jgi:hypothetical protein
MLALGDVQARVHREWRQLGLEPIGLHEARHTAAPWLDHAGVSPTVASTLMGHKTPEYQPGAALITLRHYTHTLPGELERARDQLDRFLAERTRGATRGSVTVWRSFPLAFGLGADRSRSRFPPGVGGSFKTGEPA